MKTAKYVKLVNWLKRRYRRPNTKKETRLVSSTMTSNNFKKFRKIENLAWEKYMESNGDLS